MTREEEGGMKILGIPYNIEVFKLPVGAPLRRRMNTQTSSEVEQAKA